MAEKYIDVAKEATVQSLMPFTRRKIFYYTGSVQTFIVPEHVTEIYITACGGGGQGGYPYDGNSGTPTVIGSLVTLSGGAGGIRIPDGTYGIIDGGAAGGTGGGAGGQGYAVNNATPRFFLGGGGGASLGGGGGCSVGSSDTSISSGHVALGILSEIAGENTDVAQGGSFYGAGYGKFGNGKSRQRYGHLVRSNGGFGAGGGGIGVAGLTSGGGVGSGGGGADSIVQKAFSVNPNEEISITVGKGGDRALNTAGAGGDGIVIIEW